MAGKKEIKNTQKNGKITTIKLLEETKLRLEKLRGHQRESYDDILRKILYILNLVRDDPEKAKRTLERISNLKKQTVEEDKRREEDLIKEKKEQKIKP